MHRNRLTVIAVFLLSLGSAHVAAGQQPIQNTPAGTCPDCSALERELADAERRAAETSAKLPDLQAQIKSKTSQYQIGQANRAALQAKVRAGTATAADQTTLGSYDTVMADLAREIDALSRQLRQLQEDLRIQTERAGRFRTALEACKLEPCPPPTGSGGSTDSGGTGVTPGTPDIPVLPDNAIPDCEPCEPNAEAIKKWEKDIADARAEVDSLDQRFDELSTEIERLRARLPIVRERIGAGRTPELEQEHSDIINGLERTSEALNGVRRSLRDAREGLKKLHEDGPRLEDALDKCNQSCPIPEPPRGCQGGGPGPCGSMWDDKRVLGAVGGGIATTLVILGSNGDTNTPVMPPIQMPAPGPASAVPQMPSPPMPPSTPDPPMPPPRTTADGRYRCVGVTIVSDPGGHNRTLRVGEQLTSDFDVREGSITIRHPEPFVDIVGAQFDIVTNRFFGTNVGRVAGSPNVGVSAEGTVDTTSGRIVFDYTMGTGGELPGGRSIVYRITLQKQ